MESSHTSLLGVSDTLGSGLVVGRRTDLDLDLFIVEDQLLSRYYRLFRDFGTATQMAMWMWCSDQCLQW